MQQAQPHPASLAQVTAGVCAPSLMGWLPSWSSLPFGLPDPGTLIDTRSSSQSLLQMSAPAQAHKDPLTSLCGPSATFLLQHAESFVLRKPKREKVVLLTWPSPSLPPPVRHSPSWSCGLLNPHDHPCGRSDFQITVEDAGALGGEMTCPRSPSVVDSIVHAPKGRCPNPQACQDFADVMKLRILRWGDYPELSRWAPGPHKGPLNVKRGAEGRRYGTASSGHCFRDGGPHDGGLS